MPGRVAAFDIDGVLADVRHRLHFLEGRRGDWSGFFGAMTSDGLLAAGALAVQRAVDAGLEIVYMTGRPETYRQVTAAWLEDNGLPEGRLLMRPAGDRRPARLWKRDALAHLSATAPVAYVVDDDPGVVEELREAGYEVVLADWMGRADGLHAAQESDGRT